MRLWHKDLIRVLPRQQLVGQWRECCLIARTIKEKGSPHHILLNKIMDYPSSDFYHYGMIVCQEMIRRYYKCDFNKFAQYFDGADSMGTDFNWDDLFHNWHDKRYLKQCYYNLQEKFDCGGIPVSEWLAVCYELQNIGLS